MFKSLLSFVIVIVLSFSFPSAFAQAGWQWGKGHTGRFTTIEVFSSVMDKYGNVIAAGLGGGDTTFIGGQVVLNPEFTNQLIITKWDSSGNLLWAVPTRHANVISCEPALTSDSAGNIYVLAKHDSSSFQLGSYLFSDTMFSASFIAKISPSGSVLWVKNIATNISFGAQKMGMDADNNIFIQTPFTGTSATVGGTTLYNTDVIGGYGDMLVARYDTAGNVIWAKNFGSTEHDLCTGFAVAGNGDIYMSGLFLGSSLAIGSYTLTGYPHFLARVNKDGSVLWARNLEDHTVVYGITTTGAGQIYMTGSLDATIVIGTDTLTHIGTGPHAFDVFTASCDTLGNILWARSAGGLLDDIALNITTDGCGNIWICGGMGTGAWSPYNMDFDGHTLTLPFPSIVDGMFIASYSNVGNYLQGVTTPSGGDDYCGLLFDKRGYFYIAGDFVETQMIYGPDTLGPAPAGEEPFFIAKYRYDTVLCAPKLGAGMPVARVNNIRLFPNPAGDECIVQNDIPFYPGSVAEVYDLAGKLVNTYPLSGIATVISLTSFSPGIYLCHIVAGNRELTVKKLVVLK